jgi:hypothetical protein
MEKYKLDNPEEYYDEFRSDTSPYNRQEGLSNEENN